MREHDAHDSNDPPPSWNDEQSLGVIYFGGAPRLVIVHSRISEESFFGRGSETLFTLTEREGCRAYLQSRFLTYPPVGRPVRVADAQAWYYPADHTAVIWELLVQPQFVTEDPRENLLLRSLWTHYEAFLGQRFPDLQQFMTTWEDDFAREPWQGFVTALGYHKSAPGAFVKRVAPGLAGP